MLATCTLPFLTPSSRVYLTLSPSLLPVTSPFNPLASCHITTSVSQLLFSYTYIQLVLAYMSTPSVSVSPLSHLSLLCSPALHLDTPSLPPHIPTHKVPFAVSVGMGSGGRGDGPCRTKLGEGGLYMQEVGILKAVVGWRLCLCVGGWLMWQAQVLASGIA